MKKRKRRRTGSSLLAFALLLGQAAGAQKKNAPAQPYAQIGVTVFREPGFALPAAQVTLIPDPGPNQASAKIKDWKGSADSRGELVFRVPTTAATYTVRAVSKGYTAQEKKVSIEGETRLDVTFLLAAESK